MGRRGPQPKGEYVGQTAVLSTRITPALRAQLEAAANESGTTLSREIEHRLRRTFLEDKSIVEVFGSARNFALMRLLAASLEFVRNLKKRDADWTADAYTYDQVVRAITRSLEMFRPAGEIPRGEDALDRGGTKQGDVKAALLVEEIKNAPLGLPLNERSKHKRMVARLRSDLGDLPERATLPFATVATMPEELLEFVDEARARGVSVLTVRDERLGLKPAPEPNSLAKPGKRK
jgi:hypothetical protein